MLRWHLEQAAAMVVRSHNLIHAIGSQRPCRHKLVWEGTRLALRAASPCTWRQPGTHRCNSLSKVAELAWRNADRQLIWQRRKDCGSFSVMLLIDTVKVAERTLSNVLRYERCGEDRLWMEHRSAC